MRKKPINLKKVLWKLFSEYIRRRDKGVCITCGRRDDWKNMDAGHYIPRSVGGLALYFDEKNVHAQCGGCNRFGHGRLYDYALALKRKYGDTILEELEYKRRKVRPWSKSEYELLIKDYQKKLKNNEF